MKHYDYIIAGAGLSGLMTAYRMTVSGLFTHKSILLIDPEDGGHREKTWCFWERGDGTFEEIVCRSWAHAIFRDQKGSKLLKIFPFRYKMIRSGDFHSFCKAELSRAPNIEFINSKVTDFSDDGKIVIVQTDSAKFSCLKFLNSIPPKQIPDDRFPVLQQHFEGWFVRTSKPAFDPSVATLMDFSVAQKGNTRFMYVLPLSENEALIEYTLFSKDLLPADEYGHEIAQYLTDLKVDGYQITAKENGSIPMTVYPFWQANFKNILNIGTAGGWTKASTGYTFRNTAKQTERLIDFLATSDDFRKFRQPSRFRFYDMLLLHILAKGNDKGSQIFSSMFRKANPRMIFRFLDEETSLTEDLKIILACPKRLFIKALLEVAIGKMNGKSN